MVGNVVNGKRGKGLKGIQITTITFADMMGGLMMSVVLNAGREINGYGEVDVETCFHELMERVLLVQLVMGNHEVASGMSLLI